MSSLYHVKPCRVCGAKFLRSEFRRKPPVVCKPETGRLCKRWDRAEQEALKLVYLFDQAEYTTDQRAAIRYQIWNLARELRLRILRDDADWGPERPPQPG